MDDLISRQAAIDLYKEYQPYLAIKVWEFGEALKQLPSSQPEQKVGKWVGGDIGYCTCCGHKGCASDIWNACEEIYCPNCGSKMEEQDE